MARRTIIVDFHAMEEALRSGSARGGEFFYCRSNPRISGVLALTGKGGAVPRRVSRETLEKISPGQKNRGALLLVHPSAERENILEFHEYIQNFTAKDEALALVLDGITDPQNLGAILRSADLFEVDLVILPQRRSARGSPAVGAASAGASSYVPQVRVPNLVRAMESLKSAGFWLYAARAGNWAAEKIAFSGKIALILGSEGRGLGRLVSQNCDAQVSIPTGGHIDSLNVSVAAGILLYEVRRQGRNEKKD